MRPIRGRGLEADSWVSLISETPKRYPCFFLIYNMTTKITLFVSLFGFQLVLTQSEFPGELKDVQLSLGATVWSFNVAAAALS